MPRFEKVGLSEAELHALTDGIREGVARREVTFTVARDDHSRPLAVAAVVIDDMVCLINRAVSTNHEATWRFTTTSCGS